MQNVQLQDLKYILKFVYREPDILLIGREPLSQVFVLYVLAQHDAESEFLI